MSYHIGNGWDGGLVPIVTTSAYLNTGSLGWALAFPILVPAVMFLIASTASGKKERSRRRAAGRKTSTARNLFPVARSPGAPPALIALDRAGRGICAKEPWLSYLELCPARSAGWVVGQRLTLGSPAGIFLAVASHECAIADSRC